MRRPDGWRVAASTSQIRTDRSALRSEFRHWKSGYRAGRRPRWSWRRRPRSALIDGDTDCTLGTAELGRNRIGAFLVEVGDHDPRALAGKQRSNVLADPAGRPG